MFPVEAIKETPVKDWRRKIVASLGIALLYLLLFVVTTYPAITVFDSHFIGQGDTSQNAWNLWWIHWALSHGHLNLYDTPMLYHPYGVTLAFHTLSPFNGILGAAFQEFLGTNLPLTYNLLTLFTFVGSGITMYWLVYSLTGHSLAAIVAGIVFTFSPFRMSRVFFGNLEVYSTQFIPLLVLLLIKMQRHLHIKYAIGAALMLALTTWCSLELAFGAGLLTCLLALLGIGNFKHKAWWLVWGGFGLSALVMILPVATPMLLHKQNFPTETDQFAASMANSADLLGFFLPDNSIRAGLGGGNLWGINSRISQIYSHFYGNPCEKTVFLGYTVLGIVLIILLTARSSAIYQWFGISAVFFILCLGPILQIGGRVLVSLPYRLFFAIPFLKYGRTPSRLAVYLMLALAIVIGYGVAEWCQRRKARRYAVGLLGLLIFCEFLIIPLRSDDHLLNLSPYYVVLAKQEGESPILDVPVDLYGAQGPAADYMLYQTIHQQPIVGGYISRIPTNVLAAFEYPFIYQLRARLYKDRTPYAFSSEVMAVAEENLEALGVRYVVLHKDVLSEQETLQLHETICAVLASPLYEDEYVVVWERNLRR